MEITSFRLQTMTFEARYDPSYLLFDRAGEFWHAMRQAHPSLKMGQATPRTVACTIDSQYQLWLELERLAVEGYTTASHLDAYLTLCNEFVSMSVSTLEISLFSRVGLRVIYRKPCRTKEEASKALLELELMKIPVGKHFGIEGQPKGPHYAIRWEGETLGIHVNLRTQERKVVVETPLGDPVFDRIDKEFFDFDFDVDYYSMIPVPVGQFRAKDWIQQAMHVIRRDSKVFLGG